MGWDARALRRLSSNDIELFDLVRTQPYVCQLSLSLSPSPSLSLSLSLSRLLLLSFLEECDLRRCSAQIPPQSIEPAPAPSRRALSLLERMLRVPLDERLWRVADIKVACVPVRVRVRACV